MAYVKKFFKIDEGEFWALSAFGTTDGATIFQGLLYKRGKLDGFEVLLSRGFKFQKAPEYGRGWYRTRAALVVRTKDGKSADDQANWERVDLLPVFGVIE